MAVTVQSKTDPIIVSAASVTVAKPTGLTVGDLMIAQWHVLNGVTRTLPSGWTEFTVRQNNTFDIVIAYKIATSADVSASDFTFSYTGATANTACGILRIDGHSSANPLTFSDGEGNNSSSTTITYTTVDITPYADSLILMAICGDQSNLTNVSSYAIANSDPTWTEAWDVVTNSGNPLGIYIAYGLRSSNTATGNPTITGFGIGGQRTACVLFSVNPSKDVTITDTLTSTDTVLNNITLEVSDTVTETDTIEATKQRVWATQDKNVSTWNNQNKS